MCKFKANFFLVGNILNTLLHTDPPPHIPNSTVLWNEHDGELVSGGNLIIS